MTPTIAEQRVTMESVNWQTYVALADASAQRCQRMTYDQGLLEIMSPMLSHESAKSLLGRMVERYTEIRTIDLRASASTTFRRQDLNRGFEADESFYIANEAKIRGKEEIDLSIDPPPDLVIEIEMTLSSLNKHELFAAMEIPELWRYDGQALSLWSLRGDHYEAIRASEVLEGFPVALASELLAMRTEESETVLIRRFAEKVS